jgi:hypothetical protein
VLVKFGLDKGLRLLPRSVIVRLIALGYPLVSLVLGALGCVLTTSFALWALLVALCGAHGLVLCGAQVVLLVGSPPCAMFGCYPVTLH